ncbi:MAG: class I SAM-dependent methyltransferase [Halobacteriales archaeon]
MNPDAVLRKWFERSGEYSPRYYAHYGPDETSESIRESIDEIHSKDARILELGCSSGRHLAHLADHGYTDLTGIDINEESFEVMAASYPELADAGRFFCDAIENVLLEFDDRAYDAVYSVETLQHIHHDNEWVFEEIPRITDDLLITAEIEHPSETDTDADRTVNYIADDIPLYYRDWGRVFTEFEFTETARSSIGRETIRVFRREQ